MERINGADWVDIGGGRHGFRSQNAGAGIPGTEVTDTWLNAIQEEILKVIEAAGLVPSAADMTQLWQALNLMLLPGFAGRLAWMPVLSVATTAPPAGPTAGDAYIVPAGATGVWAGQATKLAIWTGTAWALIATKDGHGVSLPDGRIFERVGGAYVEKVALDAQSGKWSYAAAGGTANALTAALNPAPAAYVAGMRVRVAVQTTNTAAMTLNLNGLGAKGIGRKDGADLVAGSVVAGQILDLVYDGVRFQALDVVGGSGAFAIGAVKQISASGTYTPPVGCRALLVEGIGGGGAGGGATIPPSGGITFGGGGGSGGYFQKLIAPVAASYVVTIGAGGAGRVGLAGLAGGTTSFGSEASATGGSGGVIGSSASATTGDGGVAGNASGGNVNAAGSIGARGQLSGFGTASGYGGIGASSRLGGGGGASGSSNSPGSPATSPGSGGGGAVHNNPAGSADTSGGAGAAGVIIITEYF